MKTTLKTFLTAALTLTALHAQQVGAQPADEMCSFNTGKSTAKKPAIPAASNKHNIGCDTNSHPATPHGNSPYEYKSISERALPTTGNGIGLGQRRGGKPRLGMSAGQ